MNKNFLTYDQHSAFNKVIFEDRNKEYGAYVIRNEANFLLKRAFFIGVSLFVVLAIIPLVITKLKPVKEKQTFGKAHQVIYIPDDNPIKKSQTKIEKVKSESVKTQSLNVPNPTRDATKEVTISPKVTDAVISDKTQDGISVTNQNPIVDTTPKVEPVKIDNTSKESPDLIEAKVDVEADYIGGINSFRTKVLENFDTSSLESESGETIKAIVTFVVEKNGTISNIKVTGTNPDFNKQAEKTVKSIKGKWIPAKLQGDNVRSYFRFPVSMQFE